MDESEEAARGIERGGRAIEQRPREPVGAPEQSGGEAFAGEREEGGGGLGHVVALLGQDMPPIVYADGAPAHPDTELSIDELHYLGVGTIVLEPAAQHRLLLSVETLEASI